MKSLNFALIGCGAIGKRHAAIISSMGVLKAVCDTDIKKAKAFARQYDARFYTDINLLLNKETGIDVAVICTPNGLHPEHAIAALSGGCHVLCEKPMAITTVSARKMINTAIKFKRKLFVVKQNRYNPPVAFVQELLQKKQLGKLYSFQVNCFWNRDVQYYRNSLWRGTKKLDGGVLFTQFSHFIDLIYWFFGEVKTIKAFRQNIAHKKVSELEDTGSAILQMKSGVSGSINYSVNSYKKNMEGSITIFGEKGTVKIGGQYLNKLEYLCWGKNSIPELKEGKGANQYGFYEGSMSNHELVYENLISILNGSSKKYVSGEDGIKSVEIIEKIYRVAK
ncbi:MAG: Gfo/Idh/MocA family oxidoreductase [Sphingobacteriales bacterium]|nr:MAG: Gfo/Idh/MocA family oxidoreductase [Sphingobacteriales bacterium]